ncbi:MAG: ChrR family anti-sigma-E factor [Henriciella sp.]|nr:ChrR family anti-sigma-E factor [Henriciella sp.]
MTAANINDFGEIYSAYAAGCLDPAFALMLETQAALRPDVSRAIARAETIAGIILETEASAVMSEGAVQSALAMIDAIEAPNQRMKAAKLAGQGLDEVLALPEPVRDHALQACGDRGWQRLGDGVARLKLDVKSEAEVELYRIGAGRTVPRHSHEGGEFTLVVAGGYSDDSGQFGPGDLAYKGPQDTHQPTGDLDGTCYALAIREGGLRFTGAMGLLQRMLGK